MSWIKKYVLNGLLLIVSVAATLVFIEVALHFTQLKQMYLYPLSVSSGEYFKWDARLGYDIAPGVSTTTHEFWDLSYPIWSNRFGCYDYAYDGRTPYIYLAGDSFAWGYTPLEQKWGKVVERSSGLRMFTCGVPGYGTRQEVIKAQRVITEAAHPPKLIILAHFEDDEGDDANFPAYTAYNGYVVPAWVYCDPDFLLAVSPFVATSTCNVPEPQYPLVQKIKIELSAHSVLYMIAKKQFQAPDKLRSILKVVAPSWLEQNGLLHPHQAQFDDRSTTAGDERYWDAHFANIQAFKKYADSVNSKFLVVLIPFKEMVQATSTDPRWATERTKAYLAAHGIQYIDLLPVLRAVDPTGSVLYWPHDVHWTPAGNALVGSLVSDYIKGHYPAI